MVLVWAGEEERWRSYVSLTRGYASMEERGSKGKRRHGQDTDPREVSAVFVHVWIATVCLKCMDIA